MRATGQLRSRAGVAGKDLDDGQGLNLLDREADLAIVAEGAGEAEEGAQPGGRTAGGGAVAHHRHQVAASLDMGLGRLNLSSAGAGGVRLVGELADREAHVWGSPLPSFVQRRCPRLARTGIWRRGAMTRVS